MPFIFKHKVISVIALTIVVLSVLVVGRNNEQQVEEVPKREFSVRLISAESHIGNEAKIKTVGEVKSLSEVDLRAETQQRITSLSVNIGDAVLPGQVIVQLNPTDILADLQSAQAGLSAEQAKLAELKRGARQEERTSANTSVVSNEQAFADAKQSLTNAETSAKITLQNLYDNAFDKINTARTGADDAVNKLVDDFFIEDASSTPRLSFTTSATQAKIDVERQRRNVKDSIAEASDKISSTNANEATETLLRDTISLLMATRSFLERLNDTIESPNSLLAATASTYRTSLNTARANMNAQIAILNNAVQAIDAQIAANKTSIDTTTAQVAAAEIALELAKNQQTLVEAGATDEQVAAQEALVRVAAGNVAKLQSLASKTKISSPIAGVIASVPVRANELVNPGELVARIVSTDGKEVTTYLNPREVTLVSTGDSVIIEGKASGIITRIAPRIDSVTGKIETTIAINDGADQLFVGQFVSVELIPNKEKIAASGSILVPLTALKTTNNGAVVYRLTEENIVVEQGVRIGRVIGEAIEVVEGLNREDQFIANNRDIAPGNFVTIAE